MDYKQVVKCTLSDYNYIKVCIENLRFEIDNELQPAIKAVRYDKESVQTSDISSPTEEEAERLIRREARLRRELKINEAIVYKVDRCLSALNERQRRVVIRKHFRCMSWDEISGDVGYSISHCKRLYDKGIYNISVGLYGERARRHGREAQ